MKLSEKILYHRKQLGLSQEELAEQLHVSRQAISRWESGSALPDASNLWQLSQFFRVSADYLLNDEIIVPDSSSNDDTPVTTELSNEPEVKIQTEESKQNSEPVSRMPAILSLSMIISGFLGHVIIFFLSRFHKVRVPLKRPGSTVTFYDQRINYLYFIVEHQLWILMILFTLLLIWGIVMYRKHSSAK